MSLVSRIGPTSRKDATKEKITHNSAWIIYTCIIHGCIHTCSYAMGIQRINHIYICICIYLSSAFHQWSPCSVASWPSHLHCFPPSPSTTAGMHTCRTRKETLVCVFVVYKGTILCYTLAFNLICSRVNLFPMYSADCICDFLYKSWMWLHRM